MVGVGVRGRGRGRGLGWGRGRGGLARPLADGGEVARGHLVHIKVGGKGRRDGHLVKVRASFGLGLRLALGLGRTRANRARARVRMNLATATMSSVSLSGVSTFSKRSTLVSEWQKKMATGQASTLHRKVSVPGRLGTGFELGIEFGSYGYKVEVLGLGSCGYGYWVGAGVRIRW